MSKQDENISLEQALSDLKDAVEKLENTQLPLDERMDLYEKAGELAILCQKRLTEAKLRLTAINESLSEKRNTEG